MELSSQDKLWDFEIVIDDLYKNVNHIHPLKQKDILQIVKCAENTDDIDFVIVFGSAVRFDCSSLSDIDILVKKRTKTYDFILPGNIVSDVDVIYEWRADERLLEEIRKTGVFVYKKET